MYVCIYGYNRDRVTIRHALHYTTLTYNMQREREREVREKLHVKTDRESERERERHVMSNMIIYHNTHITIYIHTPTEKYYTLHDRG